MAVQPGHRPANRVTVGDAGVPASWCGFSCTTESQRCSAGEIIVVQVAGELDLCTVAILQAALDDGLEAHPAHLLVDLARMTFCSVRGLDLLTQTGHTAAENATGYAVSGVPAHLTRIWTVGWEGDLPVRYRSAAAAVTTIRAHHGRS